MNIVWKKPDGTVTVSFLSKEAGLPEIEADILQKSGAIPMAWVMVSSGVVLPADFSRNVWRWDEASGSLVKDASAAVSSVWEVIKAERDRRTEQGGFCVGTKWFHSDQKSRSQHLGLILMGAGIPGGLQWKTMDGSFITMTQTLAQQILTAAAASDQAIFAAAEAHRQAMEASADPAAYDFSTGWPKVFGE